MPLPLVPLIADIAAEVSGPIGSFVSGAANFISGIFGNNEDKSTGAYQAFLSSGGTAGVVPPPRDEICYWAAQAKWEQAVINDLYNTYNQSDGTFRHGDWRGVIISTWPITAKLFKGAGESFVLTTTDFYSPDVGTKTVSNMAPVTAAANQVSDPKPAPVSSPMTTNIAATAAQTLGLLPQAVPDYNDMARDIIRQVISQESKGENSSLGTTTETTPKVSGVPMWVWLLLAGGAAFYLFKNKK